jgi:acyl phosphate:glycerol-3-phosphate acyltransferase
MPALIIRILLAYLLGSVIGSLIVGKFYGGVDIRKSGSGNAGSTNALRTQGKVFALWVMAIDAGKGALAVGVLPHLPMMPVTIINSGWVAVLCGSAAVVGHVFPVFFRFHGGKGAATFLGVLLILSWPALILALAVWALVLMLSGFVSLATMLAACSVPVYALVSRSDGLSSPLFWFGVVMALFIVFTHRANIRRLREGTENQFRRAMLLHRQR